MKGRKGDVDVENRLGDTVGGGESGANGESSINTYTPLGVRWIDGERLVCNTGSPVWLLLMIWRKGIWGGGESQERGGIRIVMADLPCCMAETNSTL